MRYTLYEIVKQELLISRNGPYKHIATLMNLIKRGQLKAQKVKSHNGYKWQVDSKEIIKFNSQKTNKMV